ncbi:MAG TPA: phosphate regulon sensor histidine kinase PhoR [Candidatus Aphodousia gallistercoris]|nr:phosphate regulon sensor histidine kinase PhoR [Candidatus Aphodousia gallistercoris]
MPIKFLTPRQQTLLALAAVLIFGLFIYSITSLQTALIYTLVAMLALVCWICLKLTDGWLNANEADQLRHDQSKITARIDRYRLSLSALPEGVVLFRKGHTIEWCNPAAETHLGIKLTVHLGLPLKSVIEDPRIVDYLEKGDYSKPIKVRSKEVGRELLLSAVVADNTHFIIVTHDITEQHRIDSMRKDFVANVSHELRTPLTVVTGFLDMIINGPKLDEKTLREQLKLMQEEASRMQNLVNDLLALSRLENKDDNDADDPEIVSMTRMVPGIAEDGIAVSQGRHLIDTRITTDKAVLGHVDEIRSACLNLVTNAVRYTPDGGKIVISWNYDPVEKACVYSVKDNGIGIAKEDIPRLTERFYRVDKSRSREKGGTGLGLAIVKHVAIRNGCKLKIESELGKGSTFSLIFPSELIVD